MKLSDLKNKVKVQPKQESPQKLIQSSQVSPERDRDTKEEERIQKQLAKLKEKQEETRKQREDFFIIKALAPFASRVVDEETFMSLVKPKLTITGDEVTAQDGTPVAEHIESFLKDKPYLLKPKGQSQGPTNIIQGYGNGPRPQMGQGPDLSTDRGKSEFLQEVMKQGFLKYGGQ